MKRNSHHSYMVTSILLHRVQHFQGLRQRYSRPQINATENRNLWSLVAVELMPVLSSYYIRRPGKSSKSTPRVIPKLHPNGITSLADNLTGIGSASHAVPQKLRPQSVSLSFNSPGNTQ